MIIFFLCSNGKKIKEKKSMKFRNYQNCGIHPIAHQRYRLLPPMEHLRAKTPVVAHSLGLLGKVPLFPPFNIHVVVKEQDPRCMFTVYPNDPNWEMKLVQQCEEVYGSRGIVVVYNGVRIGTIPMVNIWNTRDSVQYAITATDGMLRVQTAQSSTAVMSDEYIKRMVDEIHKRVVMNIINQLKTLDAPSIAAACSIDNVKRATHSIVISQVHPVDERPFVSIVGKCGVTMMDDFVTRVSQNVCKVMHDIVCGVQNAKCAITRQLIIKRAKSNLRSCRFHEWLCSIKARWERRMSCLNPCAPQPPLPAYTSCSDSGEESYSSSDDERDERPYAVKCRGPSYDSWSHMVHNTVLLGAPYSTIDARFELLASLKASPIAEVFVAPNASLKRLVSNPSELNPLNELLKVSKEGTKAAFGDIVFLTLKSLTMTRKLKARDISSGEYVRTVFTNIKNKRSLSGATKKTKQVRVDVSFRNNGAWELLTSHTVVRDEKERVLGASLCVPILDTSYLFAVYTKPTYSSNNTEWVYSGSYEITLRDKVKPLKKERSVSTRDILARLDKIKEYVMVESQSDVQNKQKFVYPFMISPWPLAITEKEKKMVVFSNPRNIAKLNDQNWNAILPRQIGSDPRTYLLNKYLRKVKYIRYAISILHKYVKENPSGIINVKTSQNMELFTEAWEVQTVMEKPIGARTPDDFLGRVQDANRVAASSEGFTHARYFGTLIGARVEGVFEGKALLKTLEDHGMETVAVIISKYMKNFPAVVFEDEPSGELMMTGDGYSIHHITDPLTLHVSSNILDSERGKTDLVSALIYHSLGKVYNDDKVIETVTDDLSLEKLKKNYSLYLMLSGKPRISGEEINKALDKFSTEVAPNIISTVQIMSKNNKSN